MPKLKSRINKTSKKIKTYKGYIIWETKIKYYYCSKEKWRNGGNFSSIIAIKEFINRKIKNETKIKNK